MAFDLGDPIPLSVTVKDANGAAANATAMVLTITLPDLTPATPAVTGTAGVYTLNAPFIATQPGRHLVRWVATGTNAATYSDDFTVLPADPGFVISLSDARAGLGLAAANTIKDEDLRTYIAAATPIMEDIVGPILRTTRVETYDGGATRINLMFSPIISVSSVVESWGSNYAKTLTAQNIFDGSGTDSYGYTVDLATGVMVRRAAGVAVPFVGGQRNVQITYVSGRTSINGNILLATRRLIRHLWQQEQQGYRPAFGAPEQAMASTPMGFAVPKAVLEMCADATRLPGMA